MFLRIEGWGEWRSLLLEESNLFHSGKIKEGELETNGFISGSHATHGDAAYELSVTRSPHWCKTVGWHQKEMSPFFQRHKMSKLNPAWQRGSLQQEEESSCRVSEGSSALVNASCESTVVSGFSISMACLVLKRSQSPWLLRSADRRQLSCTNQPGCCSLLRG